MRSVHLDEPTCEQELVLDLDEIARQGAKKMLAQALQAEVEACLRTAEGERDGRGRALVVEMVTQGDAATRSYAGPGPSRSGLRR